MLVSPALGIFLTSPSSAKSNGQGLAARRERHGAKSAPPQIWHRRRQFLGTPKNQTGYTPASFQMPRPCTAGGRRVRMRPSGPTNEMRLKVDDVLWLAEHAREVTSLENRRCVMEEAQKVIRQETTIPDTSRPHSVIGVGLQARTSPMPISGKHGHKSGQVDHIPVLLSLPSDRTFIPSPDQNNTRHLTTPADDINVTDERSQSVARQCCEIMGPSLCRTCRKLESRLLNREQAERECPRMRITQENITTTQIVKRIYPTLTDTEIQDKIARGEIARTGFLSRKCGHHLLHDSSSEDEDSDDPGVNSSSEENSVTVKKDIPEKKKKFTCQHACSLMLELAKMKTRLKNQTSTPLYFTDLKRIQSKILSGEVDRKEYLTKQPKESLRLKSAISSVSTASSSKTTLSKLGVRLSESLMPVFVSPRKVKICDEPSYKAYYEPPLLSKRRQIPNPSFFAGSSEAYSLPERLPDIIEFADSKIKQLLEKQGRSVSSLSMLSNASEDTENLASERAGESARSVEGTLNRSGTQRELRTQKTIKEQSEHETNSTNEEGSLSEGHKLEQNGVIDSTEDNTNDRGHNKSIKDTVISVGNDNCKVDYCEHQNTIIIDQEGHLDSSQDVLNKNIELSNGQRIKDNNFETNGHSLVEENGDNDNEEVDCEMKDVTTQGEAEAPIQNDIALQRVSKGVPNDANYPDEVKNKCEDDELSEKSQKVDDSDEDNGVFDEGNEDEELDTVVQIENNRHENSVEGCDVDYGENKYVKEEVYNIEAATAGEEEEDEEHDEDDEEWEEEEEEDDDDRTM